MANCATPRRRRASQIDRKEEERWIKASVAGDQKAFTRLYTRYYSQVYGFCVRMMQGRSDVEDAVQQVFLEAWRSLYRFEGRSLFSTWLTKIAIHTCLSIHRKSRRIFLSVDEDNSISEKATEIVWGQSPVAPDDQVWASAQRRAISKILSRMTKKKQIVFMLSDVQGMTAPEISRILGIPHATVRTRLFHARREFANWVSRNPTYRDLLASNKRLLRRLA